jgi:hypothetical protein
MTTASSGEDRAEGVDTSVDVDDVMVAAVVSGVAEANGAAVILITTCSG